MTKTYQQYISEVRDDIESEGYEAELGVYMDIAESLLFDPAFLQLAEEEFPYRGGMTLKECVAHSI